MQPIKLEFNAWGPYPQKVELDFSRFTKGGVFLITGATGSGKTTIFDAISYSLYGEVSGRIRDKNSVRSDLAKPEQETFVELLFEHNGEAYTVRRTPRYQRPKKKGTGMAYSNETAQLEEKGKIIVGVSEVNARIEALLGISYSQFKQIAMIAQGEFMELLLSNSKEKSIIFRNLFQTEKYNKISKLLTEQSNQLELKIRELKHKLDENMKAIQVEATTIECEWDAETIEEWNQIDTMEYCPYEKIDAFIKKLTKLQKDKISQIQEEIDNIEAIQNEYTILIARKERIELLEKRGEELEEKRKQIYLELENNKENKQEIEVLEKETVVLQSNIQKLEEWLLICNKTDDLKKERKQLEKQRNHLQTELEQQIEKQKVLQAEKQEKEEQEKRYGKLEEKIIQNQKELEQQEITCKEFEALQNRLNLYKEQKEILNQLQTGYEIAAQNWKQIKKIYEEKEEQYRAGMIGLIAQDLEEGKPCPVCGAMVHPKKAEFITGTPTEIEVQKWKRKEETAREEYQTMYEKAALIHGKVVQMEHEWGDLLEGEDSSFLSSLEGLEQKQESYKMEKEAWNKKRKETLNEQNILWKQKEEYELWKQKKESVEQEEIQIQEKINKTTQLLYEIEMVWRELNGRILSTLDSIPEELQKKETLICEKRKLEKNYNKKLEQIRKRKEKQTIVDDAFCNIKAAMEENQRERNKEIELQQRKGFLPIEIQKGIGELKKEQEQKKVENSRFIQQREELTGIIKGNTKVIAWIKQKWNEKELLEKEYGIVKDLDKVTKGDNPKRIVLEQYVLSLYFEQVLKEANKRFTQMTMDRYQLRKVSQVMDGRTKNFLDLEVMDYYTGKIRSIHTLSGGELFKAALSLALGLSDVVQHCSGGINMDIMFIDEGFGGLDAESLEQALKTLECLAGGKRFIGIISHVAELKERIQEQIIVYKRNNGSKLCISSKNEIQNEY